MKRHTGLKVVSREETGTEPSESRETRVVSPTERGILATLGEMERMIEASFSRPFFGFNMLPMQHLLHNLGSIGEFSPTIDVFDARNEVVVKAELAGMKRDDINVEFIENSLVISGEKKAEETVERKGYYRAERSYGSFKRALALPEGIDPEKANASFKDGILEIRIPKTAETRKVRHVTIH